VDSVRPAKIGTMRYWEMRAEEARARADEMHDPDGIATMIVIARAYELMARRIAERKKVAGAAR